jgi:hypothetical protein
MNQKRRRVYVPCRFPNGINGPAVVKDFDGREAKVVGRIDLVDSKLCMIASVLEVDDEHGYELVLFRNGECCWVKPGTERKYSPDDAAAAILAS